MGSKSDFVLGYMPTRRAFFSKEEAFKESKKILAGIRALEPEIKIIDLSFLNSEGLLYLESDASVVARKFREVGVDAVFAPHCNFGCESAVAMAARELQVPLLIWGPRDTAPEADGSRLRDSQCGLFATSIVLQRFGVKYTYIISSHLEDEVFQKGFRTFIAGANVRKSFRNARIGQIGSRPRDFYSVIFNESELLEKFGIQTIPVDPSALYREARSIVKANGEDYQLARKLTAGSADCSGCGNEELVSIMAGFKLAIQKWAKDENLAATSIQCWDSMQAEIGICPCYINSLLGDEKFPVACEPDQGGAVSQLILQSAQFDAEPVFLSDLTIRHPENDNAELLWHCGPFPVSLAEGECKIQKHFVLPSHAPGVCNWQLRNGHLSVTRFGGINGKYSLFAGEGDVVPGPYNQGTYAYMQVNDWPAWERKLIDGPFIHHIAGAYGKATPTLYEFARYEDEIEFVSESPTPDEIRYALDH